MKNLVAITVIVLLCMSRPASAQVVPVDLCQFLANGGFEQDFDFSTCSEPNDNYECPIVPGIVQGGPDNNFVRIDNPGDQDIAGKVVHDAQSAAFPTGTSFLVRLLANRGRRPNPVAPFLTRAPTLHLGIFGWREGTEPVIDPDEDNWNRRPNALSCKFQFATWAAPGSWSSQTFTCTAQAPVAWVSMTIAGVNHSQDSYVAFDCDTR